MKIEVDINKVVSSEQFIDLLVDQTVRNISYELLKNEWQAPFFKEFEKQITERLKPIIDEYIEKHLEEKIVGTVKKRFNEIIDRVASSSATKSSTKE